ncbi:hypothetical protein Pmani_017732 [Petrolisthes manimaculis]|uniref:FLYWCH-type domain-containing protein n=2 Tax=Petrolisthes manimaculis TaxID=1843537 RepID=A0AAE1U7H6_9EUCA|nr:hypothetical protein Pmani_017732 [Petrolisthes manimaculis]
MELEVSLEDPPLQSEEPATTPVSVSFQIIVEGTKRGHKKLIDSLGYTYNIKSQRSNVTYWQCTVRPKVKPCKATVIQRSDKFVRGTTSHNHHPSPDSALTTKISSKVKKMAVQDLFKPASAIVDEIQEVGLQHAYTHDEATFKYLRKLMALPFLPEGEITLMFERLASQATTTQVRTVIEYISRTWINGSVWPPSTWSIFNKSVRTNNDIEGWHNRLNKRAVGRSSLPFYLLITLLHKEAKLTSLHIRLVSEKKLRRIQRRKYRELQNKLFILWDEYLRGDRSALQLLKACSHLNGPVS